MPTATADPPTSRKRPHASPPAGDDGRVPRQKPRREGGDSPGLPQSLERQFREWFGAFKANIGPENADATADDFARKRYDAGDRAGQAARDYRQVLRGVRLRAASLESFYVGDWLAGFVLAGGPHPKLNPVVDAFCRGAMMAGKTAESAAREWSRRLNPPSRASDVGARDFDELAESYTGNECLRGGQVKHVWAYTVGGEFYGVFKLSLAGPVEKHTATLYRLLTETQWAGTYPERPAESYGLRKDRVGKQAGTGKVDLAEHPGGLIVSDERGNRWVVDEGRVGVVKRGVGGGE